jgi:hypothetical protein
MDRSYSRQSPLQGRSWVWHMDGVRFFCILHFVRLSVAPQTQESEPELQGKVVRTHDRQPGIQGRMGTASDA